MSPKRRMPALLASTLTGPEALLRVLDQRGPRRLVAHVVVHEVHALPERELVGERLARLLGDVGDHDLRALGDERPDDAGTLSLRAAGDDRDLAVETAHECIVPQMVSCMIESAAKPTAGSRPSK